jgi:chorismate lyase
MGFATSNWRPRRDPLRRRVPSRLRPWLEDAGSLTARIQHFCHGGLRVRVLSERWAYPAPDEAQALALRAGVLVRVREVLLTCRGVPLVYARTAMPLSSLTGRGRALLRLGTRPLGSVLFDRLSVERSPLLIRQLRAGDRLLARVQTVIAAPPGLWARRSLLSFSGRRLLVTEVFLPELVGRLSDKEHA